jgi:hypothetical protein
LKKIKGIIDQEIEIRRWIRLGGDQKDAKKKQEKVIELYNRISSVNTKIKKPKPKKYINSYLRKGDCIAIKDEEGKYSAAVAMTEEETTEYGLNLMLVLKYYNDKKPDMDFYINADCLLAKDIIGDKYLPFMIYCYAKDIKRIKGVIEKIGNISINIKYKEGVGRSYGSWNTIASYNKRLSAENTNAKPIKAKSHYKKGLFK